MIRPPPIRFTRADAEAAHDVWKFNCAPAALCAMTGKTPDEIRPHMGDFESKGYTNPTTMWRALKSLGLKWKVTADADDARTLAWPSRGLARIQWGGPWTRPGVPMAARYRKTHWVGAFTYDGAVNVFDVNAMPDGPIDWGGWGNVKDWAETLVPELLRECEPKADGRWWITHAVEISQ